MVNVCTLKAQISASKLTSFSRISTSDARASNLVFNQPPLQRLHNAIPIGKRRKGPFLLGSGGISNFLFNIPCAVGHERLQVESGGRIVRGYVFPVSRGAVRQE